MNAVINTPFLPIWPGDETLRCTARVEETPDCATFELAAGYSAQFVYHPGQFVTLGIEIEGRKHHRAYSISSSPSRPDTLAITVKRVEGGLVSNHLIDHIRPGDSFEVSAPMGEFHLNTAVPPKEIVLLSSGSGITPVMSMARWLLDTARLPST
jgi:NADH oxidoreductase Hcr